MPYLVLAIVIIVECRETKSKNHIFIGEIEMKKLSTLKDLVVTKVNPNVIRIAIAVVSLVLFALAAGAPDAMGGVGMK